MEMQAVEAARRWLADQGVRQVHDGWVSDKNPDVLLTPNHPKPCSAEPVASWNVQVRCAGR
ncbi:hypothetical protein [Streptomyces chartreusis]|uniref:hypothetical protein n=1 Tax=Streptomyces chartreusis TaxID=1969 RepID=UPI003664B0A9